MLKKAEKRPDRIPFKMHPRIFSALGADLVTSDVVAIIELVKNSYDAFAKRVDVRLGANDSKTWIEIEDDGLGMSRSLITEVWTVVATPYRGEHPITRSKRKSVAHLAKRD